MDSGSNDPYLSFPNFFSHKSAISANLLKNYFCGFVGNIDADSRLTLYTHKHVFDRSRLQFNFENCLFFQKYAHFPFLAKSADMADLCEKKLGKLR